MEKYLKYWDKIFRFWVENGSIPPEESYWDKDIIGLLPELMPEPYIGDPYNSSVVIMNYNPGAPKYDLESEEGKNAYEKDAVHHSGLNDPSRMCYHYARNYRERVASGGYFSVAINPMNDDTCLTQDGKCWWCKRLRWFKEIDPNSTQLPFNIELCGWHSHKWNGIKYTPVLLAKLKDLLAPAIEEAIKHSELGIGIAVGAQWGAVILPAFGYKDVTGAIMDLKDYKRGWKPLGGTRNYSILRNDNDTYIINTWKAGFGNMDVPQPEFRPIEKEMIKRIKAQINKNNGFNPS